MKKYPMVAILLLAVVIAGGCGQSTKTSEETPPPKAAPQSTYTDVSPAQAKNMIDENPDLIVIDVSPAYANGHLPGAVNYPVGDGTLDKTIPTLDKDATYLVYCHLESASRLGAQKLVDAGFMHVYRLAGEYDGWVEAGYPIEK
jgi:rhodanese-related sulfurtransferase